MRITALPPRHVDYRSPLECSCLASTGDHGNGSRGEAPLGEHSHPGSTFFRLLQRLIPCIGWAHVGLLLHPTGANNVLSSFIYPFARDFFLSFFRRPSLLLKEDPMLSPLAAFPTRTARRQLALPEVAPQRCCSDCRIPRCSECPATGDARQHPRSRYTPAHPSATDCDAVPPAKHPPQEQKPHQVHACQRARARIARGSPIIIKAST